MFSHFVRAVISCENRLGRIDKSALTDQALMELLIENFTSKSKEYFTDGAGDFIDACEWEGMHCDTDGRMRTIDLVLPLAGEINFTCVPPTVTSLNLHYQADIRGTIDTSKLPENLRILFICESGIGGPMDMRTLPATLRDCSVMTSEFCGPCELTALPAQLVGFTISSNNFSGEVDLTHLPASIEILNLGDNRFSGEICLQKLPPALTTLVISSNAFSGDFVLTNIPHALEKVRAEENSFQEVATVEHTFTGVIILYGNSVREVRDENGGAHPHQEAFLSATIRDFLPDFLQF